MNLIDKLHPRNFTSMSPKMIAIVAFILGETWTDPFISDMIITSDNFVLAMHNGDCGYNEFIGSVDELDRNWYNLIDVVDLTKDEKNKVNQLYLVKTRKQSILI